MAIARIDERLKELGIVLPALPQPGGNYLPARTVGPMVYLSGVISIHSGEVVAGTVGAGRTIEEGYSVGARLRTDPIGGAGGAPRLAR